MSNTNFSKALEKVVMDQPTLRSEITGYVSPFYTKMVFRTILLTSIAGTVALFIIGFMTNSIFVFASGSMLSCSMTTLMNIKSNRKENKAMYQQAALFREQIVGLTPAHIDFDRLNLRQADDYLQYFRIGIFVDLTLATVVALGLGLLLHTPFIVPAMGYAIGCTPAWAIRYLQYRYSKKNEIAMANFVQING
jgi:hypothetical protein